MERSKPSNTPEAPSTPEKQDEGVEEFKDSITPQAADPGAVQHDTPEPAPTPRRVKLKVGERIRWQKLTGTLYLQRGKEKVRIRAGDKFYASVDEIPPAFRDTCRPLDPLPEDDVEFAPLNYRVQSSDELPGKYDVVDLKGKKINSKPLSVTEAEGIVAQLG